MYNSTHYQTWNQCIDSKPGISILITSNNASSFDDSLEPDLSLCSPRCNKPIELVAYAWAVNALAGQI